MLFFVQMGRYDLPSRLSIYLSNAEDVNLRISSSESVLLELLACETNLKKH